jgi:signal transduction histidine kinase
LIRNGTYLVRETTSVYEALRLGSFRGSLVLRRGRCRPARRRTTVSHVDARDSAVGAGHAADGRVHRDPADQARLRQLAEEQAALRRVATLVAHGATPEQVFAAVTDEFARLVPVDVAAMARLEPDGTLIYVASWGKSADFVLIGSRWTLDGKNLATVVSETGRSSRVESWAGATGSLADLAREIGLRSSIAASIVVEGRVWGEMGAGSTLEEPLPPDAEARLASFTELVATAIANADSRAKLMASRARIVAAADETRRRIERDLHDGTQQQLVTLTLELQLAQAEAPPELEGHLSRIA